MSHAAEAPGGAGALTSGRVLRIAVPIVLANLTIPLLGLVDTAVIGQMGQAAPIGAVGLGATILTMLYWLFGFLRMGVTGLVAQAAGAGDRREVAALLSRGLILGLGGGMAFVALQVPLFAGAFLLAPAPDEVETLTRTYLDIRIWSAPAAIASYAVTGWLIAVERTRALLVLQLATNGLNILLSVGFVLGLGWGVEGVAWATFIAEWGGLALGLLFCRSAFAGGAWRDRALVLDPARLARMARVNADILVRSALLEAGFVIFVFTGARMGEVVLAANQILLQFLAFTAYGLDGFAFAAEVLVGRAWGARALGALRRGAWLASLWGAGIVGGFALCLALLGGGIIELMTTAEEVRAAARAHLPWLVAAPLVGLSAWMLDGVFIGATRTRDMRNMMVLSFSAFVAGVAVLVPAFGNHGLWGAMLLFLGVRAITLALRYPALEEALRAEAGAGTGARAETGH